MRFLGKEARLSQDFSVVVSSFQMMGAATEKARLPRFSFVLGIESCCQVDDLTSPHFRRQTGVTGHESQDRTTIVLCGRVDILLVHNRITVSF